MLHVWTVLQSTPLVLLCCGNGENSWILPLPWCSASRLCWALGMLQGDPNVCYWVIPQSHTTKSYRMYNSYKTN